MNSLHSKQLFRLWMMCLVLAAPVIATVLFTVHDAGHGIAATARERSGLHCIRIAGELLAAIERYRLTSDGRSAIDAAVAKLQAPDCASLAAGPRVKIGVLQSSEYRMFAQPREADRLLATLPLGDSVMALFMDISDASGLTYDASAENVYLEDAVSARIPGATERLEQSAQALKLAGRDYDPGRSDVLSVEKLLGQAAALNSITADDLSGAMFAEPDRRDALGPAQDAADGAEADLAVAIDRNVAAGHVEFDGDGIGALRATSIAAGERLLRASTHALSSSLDERTRLLRLRALGYVAGGAALLGAGVATVFILWRAQRRRDREELERARERAQTLETKLARRNAERALRLTEQQFRAVFEGSHIGIAIVDATGRIDANAALRSMVAGDLEPIRSAAAEMFARVVRNGGDGERLEHSFALTGGGLLWADVSLSVVAGGSDDPLSAIVLVHDITEHKTLNARLDHETLHDPLTRLPNRVHFVRRLEAMLVRGARFAVVFIDLDGFKIVNDSLGHNVGDDLLRLAANRLAATVRPNDFVARLHGDEFAVIVADGGATMDSGEIDEVVSRLRAALDVSIEGGRTPIRITASIGYVRDGAAYRSAETLLTDADSAMYASKRDGRDRATAFVAGLHAPGQPAAARADHRPNAFRTAGM